jgi:hypothetical protein
MKDRLAVVVSKNPTHILIETIKGIELYYPEFDIVIIDSDSTDKTWYDKVPSNCIVEFVQNKGWELGAWTYAFNKYNTYNVYMFMQDSLIPKCRIPEFNETTYENGLLYSFHYKARLCDGGYFDELQSVYKDTNLDFIANLNPEFIITGTAHTSFITNAENVNSILCLEDAYIEKGIIKSRIHCWLSERTGGLVPTILKNKRVDITPYFIKINGNRDLI